MFKKSKIRNHFDIPTYLSVVNIDENKLWGYVLNIIYL